MYNVGRFEGENPVSGQVGTEAEAILTVVVVVVVAVVGAVWTLA